MAMESFTALRFLYLFLCHVKRRQRRKLANWTYIWSFHDGKNPPKRQWRSLTVPSLSFFCSVLVNRKYIWRKGLEKKNRAILSVCNVMVSFRRESLKMPTSFPLFLLDAPGHWSFACLTNDTENIWVYREKPRLLMEFGSRTTLTSSNHYTRRWW